MSHRAFILGGLAGLAVLAAGCGTQHTGARPYETLQDIKEARRLADLVVEGEVLATEPLQTCAACDAQADVLGTVASGCAVETLVTLRVTRPIKAPPDLKGPVEFVFYSPCFAGDPGVLLGWSLPPIMWGDKLRVFLVNRGGEWRPIAHERWYRPPPGLPPRKYISSTMPGAQYQELAPDMAAMGAMVPGAGVDAAGQPIPAVGLVAPTGAPGVVQGTAPRTTAATTTRRPSTAQSRLGTTGAAASSAASRLSAGSSTSRFQNRTTASRVWPPPTSGTTGGTAGGL